MMSLDMNNWKNKIQPRGLDKSFIKNSLQDTQIDIKLRKAVVLKRCDDNKDGYNSSNINSVKKMLTFKTISNESLIRKPP